MAREVQTELEKMQAEMQADAENESHFRMPTAHDLDCGYCKFDEDHPDYWK